MQFKRAGKFILNKLRNELPAHLTYHGVGHMMDVYNAAERIAKESGISNYDQKLLLTAALFHDTGFIKGRQDHETKSCGYAHEYLPLYGYQPAEIELICGMIMATKVPQDPHTYLEEILCDADLDYLGRDEVSSISNKLFEELKFEGLVKDENEWNRIQVSFLEEQHYHTENSVKLRQAKKKEYLNLVKSKI